MKIKIIRKAFVALSVVLPLVLAMPVQAVVSSQVFQITNDSSQQSGPLIYGNLVAYTNFGGNQGIDIWGYNLKTKTNFPIIEKPGTQFLDGVYKNLIVYEDFNDTTQNYAIHLYNMKSGRDTLITPGSSSYGSGGTNGRDIVYIDGGACGKLMVYRIKSHVTRQLADGVCIPKISERWVIWSGNGASGPGIYGYDLAKSRYRDVNTGEGFADTINIFKNTVVWMQPGGTRYRIMLKNLTTGLVRTLLDTTEYYVNYPAVSNQFVVWGKSLAPGQAGVEGIDLRTNEIFEVFPQGPHQNTNLATSIWGNTAVWQAWRTGNGDIYGATLIRN